MLPAIISLLMDEPAPAPAARVIHVDMGSGGSIGPSYDILDYLCALEAFKERPGEHPVARAARRMRHLEQVLPVAKATRELGEQRAAAYGLLLGVGLERTRAAQEAQVDVEISTPTTPTPTTPTTTPAPTPPTLISQACEGRGVRMGAGVTAIGLAIAGIGAIGIVALISRRSQAAG